MIDPASTLPLVVLAAGRGNRLAPLTDETPKCLLPLDSTCPLGLLLDALCEAPPREVRIVTGHGRERITAYLAGRRLPFAVAEVFNPRFDEANNIYSAALVRRYCRDGFYLVNSDVVCDRRILAGALRRSEGSFLVVDTTLPPRQEAMKVRYAGDRLVEIGKEIDPSSADGEYIGIARFDAEGASCFFDRIETILASGGDQHWYEAAIGAAAAEISIGLVPTGGLSWIEIDDPEDLERAKRDVIPRLKALHA